MIQKEKQLKHIAKIIEKELSFTNGWCISDERYTSICLETSKKIQHYLIQSDSKFIYDGFSTQIKFAKNGKTIIKLRYIR